MPRAADVQTTAAFSSSRCCVRVCRHRSFPDVRLGSFQVAALGRVPIVSLRRHRVKAPAPAPSRRSDPLAATIVTGNIAGSRRYVSAVPGAVGSGATASSPPRQIHEASSPHVRQARRVRTAVRSVSPS